MGFSGLLLILLLLVPAAGPQVGAEAGDTSLVRELIAATAETQPIGRRIEQISARLLGRPYLTNSLTGSATEPERLVTRTDGFDCVTFVETVLAIACSRSAADFTRNLTDIRYRDSRVEWGSRLHYATEWAAANRRRGLLADVTSGPHSILTSKRLDFVPGLDPRHVEFRYFPKRVAGRAIHSLRSGDVIFFTSGREGLDTNHVGFVIFREGRPLLRNASRSHGAVVDEPLDKYLQQNKMTGFFICRPIASFLPDGNPNKPSKK